ncbi:hypothetical protein [Burkholderia sp. Z1]|uniref:hypothetical protein n=1 Tax=Burkholderia sp. Z1 TaxID=2759039 RepID=UPI0018661EC2|nr:hypothetical protein [Burkholderia sp. Z1]
MIADHYYKLQSALLSGHIDASSTFLAARHELDKRSAEHWYWLTRMYYRSGRPLDALDIRFKLTREAGALGMHFHCLAGICAHSGIKDVAISGQRQMRSASRIS